MGEPLYQDNTGPGDFSHAESSCQESFKMRIILLLTVFTTLGLCQRQSPPSTPLTEPPQGQRCAGRNFNGRRCCTPESPCGYGEGDCDGPLDGGANDGHRGCQGDLVCGSNNCKKFGTYFHEKDDCCDLPETLVCLWSLLQVRDVPGEIITARDAALLRTLVTRVREIVMVLVTVVTMTVTEAARVTSSAAPTTVSSLVLTTTPRMTAVRGPRECLWLAERCRKTRTRNCVGPQCGSLQHSEDLQEQYCRESDCDAEGFAEDERFFF